jgi:hypothetical protein
MRAAPAFELSLGLSTAERSVLAALSGLAVAALGLWIWSHVDAAAGLAGRGAWPWFGVGTAAAAAGLAAGWFGAPNAMGVLRWHQGQWSLHRAGDNQSQEGIVEAKLDLGSWMLLRFDSTAGGALWFGASRERAAATWPALRAALYAPGADGHDESVGGSGPT